MASRLWRLFSLTIPTFAVALAACGGGGRLAVTRGGSAKSMTSTAVSLASVSATSGNPSPSPGRTLLSVVPPTVSPLTPVPAGTTFGPPLLLSTSPLSPSPVVGSGVRGNVTAGPTCPVERIGHPCPPRPVEARIDARDVTGRVVGTTRSDVNGRYALSLPVGQYMLVVTTPSNFPRCPPTVAVVVAPDQVTAIDVICDTGIR